MNFQTSENLNDPRVSLRKLREYPEAGSDQGQVMRAIAGAAADLGLTDDSRGMFGGIVPRGARVLVKPNLVLHRNEGPWGMDPLVTHPSIIRSIVDGILQADPAEVIVGDAPLQGCDFEHLLSETGLGDWADRTARNDGRFKGVRDFRRTTCVFVDGVRQAEENLQSEDRFVLFDLGSESLLEPISDREDRFRVTCYDPRLLARTHAPGRHQYLVAKEIIEADVIFNLPKLKTHKKAGITCALKNLIGINGNKEYLPHHRIGGAGSGGDCYPDASIFKRALEFTSDRQNMSTSRVMARFWHDVSRPFTKALSISGDRLGIEGSWSGNDTIWRTCLDLNRILLYGRVDGTMADTPQRSVVHFADAVIAGQGDGPLSPQPLPLGLIVAGRNAAAVDWVGSQLLQYDPLRIPIVRQAFTEFNWPVASFSPDRITLSGDLGAGLAGKEGAHNVIHPLGWLDAAYVKPVSSGD